MCIRDRPGLADPPLAAPGPPAGVGAGLSGQLFAPSADGFSGVDQVQIASLDRSLAFADAVDRPVEHQLPAVLDQGHGTLGPLDLANQARSELVVWASAVDCLRLLGISVQSVGRGAQARRCGLTVSYTHLRAHETVLDL